MRPDVKADPIITLFNIIYIMRSYLWVILIQPRRMIANTLNQEIDKHPDLGRQHVGFGIDQP